VQRKALDLVLEQVWVREHEVAEARAQSAVLGGRGAVISAAMVHVAGRLLFQHPAKGPFGNDCLSLRAIHPELRIVLAPASATYIEYAQDRVRLDPSTSWKRNLEQDHGRRAEAQQ